MVGNGDAQIIFDGSPLSFLHFFIYLIVTLCIISSSSWSIHIFIKKAQRDFFNSNFFPRTHSHYVQLSLSRRRCAAHILLFLIFFFNVELWGSAPFARVNNLLYDFFFSLTASSSFLQWIQASQNDLPTWVFFFYTLILLINAQINVVSQVLGDN